MRKLASDLEIFEKETSNINLSIEKHQNSIKGKN